MINVAYIILIVIATIGILLALMPTKWYKKSSVNWRLLGAWICMLSIGCIGFDLVIRGVILICKFIWMIFCTACCGSM
jgi:hypothetical protein